MTITVKAADLRGYAGLLNRNAQHNDQILAYMSEWCGKEMQATNSEGLLARALGFHDTYYAEAEGLIKKLGQALRGSAAELEKAAKLYDGSDKAARERLESAYIATVTARDGWEASHSGYADYMNPLDAIGGSPHIADFNDPTKVLDVVGDTVSASGQALKLIEQLTGRNPVAELVQFVSGAWEAFSRAGAAWRHIGDAMERIGKNVDRGLASLDHAWDGNASEAAYAAFQQLASVYKMVMPAMNRLNEAYQDFARFAMQTAAVLADTVKLLIDIAIALLLRKRGGPFADAFAAFYGFKILKAIATFSMIILSARGTVGVIFGTSSGLKSVNLPPQVMAMAYDAPGI